MAKKLREGFTTGTAFAAAAKAALQVLLSGTRPDSVPVNLPGRRSWRVDIESLTLNRDSQAEATVIKDSGDDPDLTHGAEVGALVELIKLPPASPPDSPGLITTFIAGPGVGRITKPGLPLPPGQPAINPGPRRICERALKEVVEEYIGHLPDFRLKLTAFVLNGQDLAQKTLNPKLGIVDGLSILGTTGIVRPYSHAAYRATIVVELKVAQAAGLKRIALTTGRTTEALVQKRFGLADMALIRMGDHLGFSLRQIRGRGFEQVVVGAFFGKSVKMASGFADLRFDASPMDLGELALLTENLSSDSLLALKVGEANTARQALGILQEAGADLVIREVASRAAGLCKELIGTGPTLEFLLFDFDGNPICEANL